MYLKKVFLGLVEFTQAILNTNSLECAISFAAFLIRTCLHIRQIYFLTPPMVIGVFFLFVKLCLTLAAATFIFLVDCDEEEKRK